NTPTNTPTNTPSPTNILTPIPIFTPTLIPTPTNVSPSTPILTPTPTGFLGLCDICERSYQCLNDYFCQDLCWDLNNRCLPLGENCDLLCKPSPTPTSTPFSTLTPEATPLCCIKESSVGDPHCWAEGKRYNSTDKYPSGIYWPLGTSCDKYCPAGSFEGQWCGAGGGEPCRSCRCGNNQKLNPQNFNIPPGGTQEITAYYIPGNCSDPSTVVYRWYAFPEISTLGAITAQGAGRPFEIHYPRDLGQWGYAPFTAGVSGYVGSVRVGIVSQTEGYATIFIGEDTPELVRLSDNRGEEDAQLYGAREKYFSPGDKVYEFDFAYLTQYIEAGKRYRLYFKPRSSEYFTITAYWVWVKPSPRINTGSFSDASHCNGQSQCTITYTAPTDAPVGTRFKILAEISDNKSLFQDKFGSGNCLGGATIVPLDEDWFQTQDGDVYSNLEIRSKIPATAPSPYFSLEGSGRSPGLINYGGSSVDFGQGSVSQTGWLVNYKSSQEEMNYTYLLNKLKIDISNPLADDVSLETLSSGVYFINGSKEVNNIWNIPSNTKIVVFINGDLRINKDIKVPKGSFLALITKGNIIFAKEVANAQGWFNSEKQIIISGGGVEDPPSQKIQFKGEGVFIGWQGFQLKRILTPQDRSTKPAELFISRPDFWFNAPAEFQTSISIREELFP
ncbi:MAG: hypothetical protein Q6367_001425, partial [Candidatus Freyarchaeota archaeon]